MQKLFPHYQQLDSMDCVPFCLRMIAKHYGRSYSLQTLRERCFITRQGVSMLGISDAAESIGMHTQGVRISFKQLIEDFPLLCILHWNQNHFIMLYYTIKKKKGLLWRDKDAEDYTFCLSDSAKGKYPIDKNEFEKCWISIKYEGKEAGFALLFSPTPDFHERIGDQEQQKRNLSFYLRYLFSYKSQLFQLMIGVLLGNVFSLIIPFLTQAMVDQGIGNNNLNFITLILVSQLILSVTQMEIDFIQSWINLHMNTRISITLFSDFTAKLMRLPIRCFFDAKNIGDIMQRIGDHGRIQSFMTGTALFTLFSFLNFFIFADIMTYYNLSILVVFQVGNTLYILWILSFMRYRCKLDNARLTQAYANQSNR